MLFLINPSCKKDPSNDLDKKTIIFITGTSSIGKSSVTSALQKKLKNDWVKASDDDYFMQLYLDDNIFSNYPNNKNIYNKNDILYAVKHEDGSNELITGSVWEKISSDVIPYSLLSFLNGGFNVINDSLIENNKDLELYKEVFKDHNIVFVYLYADLNVVEKREKQRGNRLPGTAKNWLSKINIQNSCDIKIDTTNLNPGEVADRILSLIKLQ